MPEPLRRTRDRSPARPIRTAEVLSIGSELTVGETRDTNAGDLAGELSRHGVDVLRLSALPDRLDAVAETVRAACARADLVVSTGGLGPTPDDLTREAIAASIGEDPAVDADLEAWLRDLWRRRGMEFPELNLKQAWLVPSARSIPNENGTAPGWWVERSDGGLLVALPGPPREMRPMWSGWVVPRLEERGLGRRIVVRTYRLMGIGESALADLIGDEPLRTRNPTVATYARADAVDLRISATDDGTPNALEPETLVHDVEQTILPLVTPFIWGHDDDTWASVVDRALAARRWTLATVEIGTAGSLATLLSTVGRRRSAEVLADRAPAVPRRTTRAALLELAGAARRRAETDVGLAVVARARGRDTRVHVGLVDPDGDLVERRLAFLGGPQGQTRAGLTAASVLFDRLGVDRVRSRRR